MLDNAPWHNRLTEETMPPKRSWRKEFIINWLSRHRVLVPIKATKAQLLQLAFNNLPEKRYVVDKVAAAYSIQILRLVLTVSKMCLLYEIICSLPVKHCMFNPIELAWAGLKKHVRDNNTRFRLSDVRLLVQQWMTSLNASMATSYLNHARNIENTFKKSDAFIEQIEEQLIDDEDNDDDADNDGEDEGDDADEDADSEEDDEDHEDDDENDDDEDDDDDEDSMDVGLGEISDY